MLKNITPNQDLTINTFITTENDSSDRDFFNKKLLDFTTNNVINNITNGEIYEYKPALVSEINYNVFFLRYIQNSEVLDLQIVNEKEFFEHYNKTVQAFANRPISSVYDVVQDNSLREVELPDIFRDKLSSLNNSPYFIRDFVSELRLKNPNKNGIPIFYNSFSLPFYEKKDLWINDNLLFSNKPYLFNSFLLMEFYDTPSNLTQRRIHTIPIFVNSRYNLFEKPSDKNFLQERPCFKLTEGAEGFSFFFLDNFYTNEFYVRFSFWDALSGIKRDLLPSSNQETNKKWLQDPTTFKQELRYLKYTLNYETKTYNIFEYDSSTNTYDLERTDFDLYELEFDEYYKNNIVLNDTPYNAKIESKPPQPEIFNPLKFNIKNLVFDYTNTLDYTRKENLLINNYTNSNTFLDLMAPYLDSYQTFVNNTKVNSREFTDFETKKIKIPLIEGEIDSASLTLSKFSAINIDDQSWRIRRILLEDINIVNGTKNFKFNLYNETNSNISDKKKYKLAEAIFESQITERTKDPPYYFTEQLFDDFDIFEDVILAIELSLSGFPINNTIVAFINELFNLLELNKNFQIKSGGSRTSNVLFSKNYNKRLINAFFDQYSYIHKDSVYKLDINWSLYNQRGGWIGYNYVNNLGNITEFSLIKPVLIKEYNDAKINNIDLYNRMKNLCKNFMVQFYNTPRTDTISQRIYDAFGNINKIALDRYFKKFNPLNHQELLETYISLAKRQYINPYFDNNVYIRGDVNSELIRSYSLGLILLLDGDNFLTIKENLKFDLILNIGRYFKHELDLEADINITGRSRISLINNDNDIKNIIIPIDIVVKP
jgi:hypothetical protein